MVNIGVKPIRLKIQYRMHPSISLFPSKCFYESQLNNGVTEEDRPIGHVKFPNEKIPLVLWDVKGRELRPQKGFSYYNSEETDAICQIVTELRNGGIKMSDIGIIAAYKGQKNYIKKRISEGKIVSPKDIKELEISSIDSF